MELLATLEVAEERRQPALQPCKLTASASAKNVKSQA